MRRCEGTTRTGNRCRKHAPAGELFCVWHGEEAAVRRADQKRDVLEALPRVFSYSVAAQMAGVSSVTLKWWRDEDPEFAVSCLHAREDALDTIESAMMRRAVGFNESEDVYYRGEVVGTKRRFVYSDRAGEILLSNRTQYRRYTTDVIDAVGPDPFDLAVQEALTDPTRSDEIAELLDRLDPA